MVLCVVFNCVFKKIIFYFRNIGVFLMWVCLKCKIIIEYVSVCKKMECLRCKIIFCFVCFKIVIDGKL